MSVKADFLEVLAAAGRSPEIPESADAYGWDPTPAHEAEATAHLTFEGTRDQYIGDVPREIAERIDPRLWEEDWRIMSLPCRLGPRISPIFRAPIGKDREFQCKIGRGRENRLDRRSPD